MTHTEEIQRFVRAANRLAEKFAAEREKIGKMDWLSPKKRGEHQTDAAAAYNEQIDILRTEANEEIKRAKAKLEPQLTKARAGRVRRQRELLADVPPAAVMLWEKQIEAMNEMQLKAFYDASQGDAPSQLAIALIGEHHRLQDDTPSRQALRLKDEAVTLSTLPELAKLEAEASELVRASEMIARLDPLAHERDLAVRFGHQESATAVAAAPVLVPLAA